MYFILARQAELEDEGLDWSDDTTPATTLAIVFASKGGDPPELAIIARLTPKRWHN